MKKQACILFVIIMFLLSALFLVPYDKIYMVKEIKSPVYVILNNKKDLKITDFDCFDSIYTDKNKNIAKLLKISEEEAFLMGCLGKQWAYSLLKGRLVHIKNGEDLIYLKYSYKDKFFYSGFCLQNSLPCYLDGFNKKINEIRNTEYKILDTDTGRIYSTKDDAVKLLKNFIVVKKAHLPRKINHIKQLYENNSIRKTVGNVEIYFSDSTQKLKPDRNCDTSICKEILKNINAAQNTIDIAIYGYSRTPAIEEALKAAKSRGVKLRLVVDSDMNGGNIYPDTDIIKKIIPNNQSDVASGEAKSIMHNKFYVFDKKVLITGSANLSHTDMSGFNSNSMVVINSSEIADIYLKEFDNMFAGKFHNVKPRNFNKRINVSGINIDVYFSPQDKCITNAVVPLINTAKKYIYIPTFLLTDKNVTSALIRAHKRGVDIKIIIDALNASVQHSKHKELRAGGILVKTENYAGKMHSKSMIIDDEYTIIGSMNFSYSGENKNDENLLVIQNSEIAKFYKENFLTQWSRIDNKWLKYNARAEGKDSIGSCFDGIDNNYDGFIDIDDSACK